jgi:hypothetical protein
VRSVALVGGGLVAGGILAGTVSASAADDEPADSTTTQEETTAGERHRHGPGGRGGPGAGEEPLTGDAATSVEEAVLAEYPDADIRRMETDSDGVYEAHILTADGERLTVELDEEFAITGTETGRDC